jgi:hypothetical protein
MREKDGGVVNRSHVGTEQRVKREGEREKERYQKG